MVSPGVASFEWLQRVLAVDDDETGSRHISNAAAHVMEDALDTIFKQRWAFDEPVTNLFSVEIERSYALTVGSPALSCLGYGWADPEAWGTWSSADKACLCLPFGDIRANTNIKIEIDGQIFAGDHADRPVVTLCIVKSGIRQKMVEIQLDGRCEIVIDMNSIRDAGGFVTLEFLVENPISPASLGLNGDQRQLGFGLMRFQASLC